MKKTWVCGTLLGLALVACQENRIEPQTPQELGSDNLAGEGANGASAASQDAAAEVDERASPPAQITGAYLTAKVLEEKTVNSVTEARVGVVTTYKGKKVSDDPTRYNVSFTAAYVGASAGITVSSGTSSDAGYDRQVVVTGSSPSNVRKAYASTMVYLTIVDLVDHTSDTRQFPIGETLTTTTPQVSSSTQTSTSTSVGGNGVNGADGANGSPGVTP